MNLYWSAARKDNATMAGEAEQGAKDADYKFASQLGSILKEQRAGTIPLNLYWNDVEKDNATLAGEAEQWAKPPYKLVRTLGYIFKRYRPTFFQ